MKHGMIIIGFGNQGQWHADSIRERVPEIWVIGAYDIKEERATEIAKRNLKRFTSPAEEWACKEADVVLVSTPNNFHIEYCIAALEAGKNVVCD